MSYPTSHPKASEPVYPKTNSTSSYPIGINSTVGSVAGCVAKYTSSPLSVMGEPTLKTTLGFSADVDAKKLREGMKGLGTDEAALIAILCRRTARERIEIGKAFYRLFGKELGKDIKSETSGNFARVLVALLDAPEVYDAKQIRDAVKGCGTRESTLIEILCSRNNAEITMMKHAYRQHFQRDIEEDMRSDTSGHFRRLLMSLLAGSRNEKLTVDKAGAAETARSLYKAGVGRLGTDEPTFNAVIASQSQMQLRAVFDEYSKQFGHDIEKAIKLEMSGDLADGMLAVVKCLRSPAEYFAERLHHAMSGAGTDDKALVRLIVTRADRNLETIKRAYLNMYGKTLEAAIKSDTSGDYRKALLTIAGY